MGASGQLLIIDLQERLCWFQVKVILGEDRECVGQLLSIDNQEGVVKLDKGISLLQLTSLCRMPKAD